MPKPVDISATGDVILDLTEDSDLLQGTPVLKESSLDTRSPEIHPEILEDINRAEKAELRYTETLHDERRSSDNEEYDVSFIHDGTPSKKKDQTETAEAEFESESESESIEVDLNWFRVFRVFRVFGIFGVFRVSNRRGKKIIFCSLWKIFC